MTVPNKLKVVWLAIVAPASALGYCVTSSVAEVSSWQGWAKQRGQLLLGEFRSHREAREAIANWLAPPAVSQTNLKGNRLLDLDEHDYGRSDRKTDTHCDSFSQHRHLS
jgi:hypothetical protein